jgi:acetyltransferase-like isoleucine patch superfamily enzyme
MNKKILRWLDAPLSNKILVLRGIYWRIRTQLCYRPMFKSLGRKTVIYRPMLISNADCIAIGDKVSIRDGVRLEAIRDLYGRTPCLTIGSNTLIEQGVQIVCHSRVTIGRDVAIAGRCAIVDVTHPYREVSVGNIGAHIANDESFVEIGDGAFLGYGAVILPNVRIGMRAVIGANSVVTHDVPDFAVVAGSPAKLLEVIDIKRTDKDDPTSILTVGASTELD